MRGQPSRDIMGAGEGTLAPFQGEGGKWNVPGLYGVPQGLLGRKSQSHADASTSHHIAPLVQQASKQLWPRGSGLIRHLGNPIGMMRCYRVSRVPWEGSLDFSIVTAIE
jgi:hypothetical protein